MAPLTFEPATEKVHTRDGRQWLKDTEFCDGIRSALKRTYDSEEFLKVSVTGIAELRKVRGALRYFAEEESWGLSLRTTGDPETKTDGTFVVTFRAQVKRPMPETAKPRKVRRRKNEADEAYAARVREAYPRNKGEKEAEYAVRLAAVTATA